MKKPIYIETPIIMSYTSGNNYLLTPLIKILAIKHIPHNKPCKI
jgi:hypothetical protein